MPALALGLVALMIGPTLWAAIPIFQGARSLLAGPARQGVFSRIRQSVDPVLVRYLEEHQGNAHILVATNGNADGLILATNKPVMPLAGWSSYPLTTTELASLVSTGKLRFLLLDELQGPGKVGSGPSNDQQNEVLTWAKQHCQGVPSSEWQSASTSSDTAKGAQRSSGPEQRNEKLYDCAATH
jgi:hypothetical protein